MTGVQTCALPISPDADPEPLEAALAPFLALVDGVAGMDPRTLVHRRRVEHRIEANWKAVVENFIECYHCPLVHSETLPGYGGDDYRIGQVGPLHTQHLDDQRFCFAYLYPTTQLSAYGLEHAFVARALQPIDVLPLVALASTVLWAEEARKAIARRMARNRRRLFHQQTIVS